jgi:hypothetical protein
VTAEGPFRRRLIGDRRYVWLLAVGPRFQDFTLYASNSSQPLQVLDFATVKSISGPPALIANAGTSQLVVGNSVKAGSLEGAGSIGVGVNTQISGSITAAGSVTLGAGDSVTGPVLQYQSLSLPGLSVPLTFPPSSGDVTVNLNQSVTLAPGSYGKISVFGTMTLAAGTYFINKLDVEPSAVVNLNKGGGPIILDVQSELDLDAPLRDTGSEPGSDILVNYVGTNAVVLAYPFVGTLAAPSATVYMNAIDRSGHTGVFLAHTLVVQPQTLVTRQPFNPACN